MKIILFLLKLYLKVIYFIINVFTRKRKRVFFLSRQTNEPSLNYSDLIKYIQKKDKSIEIKISCKRVSENLNVVLHAKDKSITNMIKAIIKELKSCFIYFCVLHLQMYYIATSRVIIIDGYNILISCLKHKKNTTVIQMWHALAAIKKFGYQSIGLVDGVNPKNAKLLNLHSKYDYILSGSKAMQKPFSEAFNTAKDKILDIGTPYVDHLLSLKVDKEVLFVEYKELLNKPIILYSPTFRKDGSDGIKSVIDSIDTKKYNLVITLHPLAAKNANKYHKDGVLINPKIEYAKLLKSAEYVITDYSALMVEASILKTKLLLYVYDYEKYVKDNGINIDLFKELPGLVFRNIKDLIDVIDNNNYDLKVLNKFRKKYTTVLDGTCTEKIYKLIKGELK